MTLSQLQELLLEKQSLLESYKNDPLRYFENEITTDHDNQLCEQYASNLDNLPFYVCGRGSSAFAEFVKSCDSCFYTQSLNDFADSYDVTNLSDYTDLESEIEAIESQIEDLQDTENDE
jgi:hypothetical protein